MGVVIEFKPRRVVFDSLMDRNYQKYLASPEWKEIRRELIERAEGCCEECGCYVGNHGEAHHTSYENLFQEDVDELRYLCAYCHP